MRWLNVVKIPMIYLLSKYMCLIIYIFLYINDKLFFVSTLCILVSTNIYIIGVSHINVSEFCVESYFFLP